MEEETNAKLLPSDDIIVPAVHEEAGGHNPGRLLTKLLPELEEDKGIVEKMKKEDGGCSNEEIMKELKNIKRQNSITHYLLTAMIVVTLAWQLSEASLVFKIKHRLSNPLKSVAGLIQGFFRRNGTTFEDVMKQASETRKQITDPTYLPGFKIPELPHLDMPGFDEPTNLSGLKIPELLHLDWPGFDTSGDDNDED